MPAENTVSSPVGYYAHSTTDDEVFDIFSDGIGMRFSPLEEEAVFAASLVSDDQEFEVIKATLVIENPYEMPMDQTHAVDVDLELISDLRKQGHDGLISRVPQTGEVFEYVVFDRDQITVLGTKFSDAPSLRP